MQLSLEPRYMEAFRQCFELVDTQTDFVLLALCTQVSEQAHREAYMDSLRAQVYAAEPPKSRPRPPDGPEAVAYATWANVRCALGLDRNRPPGAVLDKPSPINEKAHPDIEWLYRCDNSACPRRGEKIDHGRYLTRHLSLRCSRCRKALCARAADQDCVDVLRLYSRMPVGPCASRTIGNP